MFRRKSVAFRKNIYTLKYCCYTENMYKICQETAFNTKFLYFLTIIKQCGDKPIEQGSFPLEEVFLKQSCNQGQGLLADQGTRVFQAGSNVRNVVVGRCCVSRNRTKKKF